MNFGQLTNQIILMFLLMLIGVLINKLGFMHAQTSNDLTNILLYVVSPCLIVNAFEQRFSPARMQQLAIVMVGIVIFYILEIILAKLIFGRLKDPNLRRIAQYGSVYSNAGFMGIPLTSSLFGTNGVFFAVASLAGFNLFSWTHGVSLFKEHDDDRIAWRDILLNPNIIAIIVGLLIFLFSIQLPTSINRVITYVGSVNTPLSMIVIGNSLANVHFDRKILSGQLGWTIILRNLAFPILMIIVLKLLGVTGVALYTTVLMSACPVAGIVVLFTLKAHGEPGPAVALMSISTILSLLTIPIVFAMTNLQIF